MIDIKKLCQDYHIQFWESGKNVAAGWINLKCPFCTDTSNHLGFSPQGHFVCWKCGSHPLKKVLQKILRIDEQDLSRIFRDYGGAKQRIADTVEERVKIGVDKFQFPSNIGPMLKSHHTYLNNRNFNSKQLERWWNLLGTGPIAKLDNIDFKYRIIIPIMWDEKVVSFQARDYTNKQTLRYITCPKNREIVHHKHILYGLQNNWTDTGIIVEGVTDVWRLGPRACATFGIEYTLAQVREIKKHFKRVYILFDCEPQAQEKAYELSAELNFRGISNEVIMIENDPGSMNQTVADMLVNQLT
jgi:hypothetical protein